MAADAAVVAAAPAEAEPTNSSGDTIATPAPALLEREFCVSADAAGFRRDENGLKRKASGMLGFYLMAGVA